MKSFKTLRVKGWLGISIIQTWTNATFSFNVFSSFLHLLSLYSPSTNRPCFLACKLVSVFYCEFYSTIPIVICLFVTVFARLKLNYLYTNELPHLPWVTFLQSSHYLETKGIWQATRSKKKKDTHPGTLTVGTSLCRRHLWILRDAIHIGSETGKIIIWHFTLHLLACKLCWNHSLVKLAIRWNQSPRNWHRRASNFGTNPQGWNFRWCCHDGDVTISIMCNVPLQKENYLLNTWTISLRMLPHLRVVVTLRLLHCSSPKVDCCEVSIARVPINVCCSIFNEILPIRDRWAFNLDNGHWLIRTQAWAISVKDWDVAFFQWSIAWYVRKNIGVGKFWGSLHSWNASFDGWGTVWWRNRICSNTTKRRLLWVKGYFRWHFITVDVEQIVHFPQQSRLRSEMLWKEK